MQLPPDAALVGVPCTLSVTSNTHAFGAPLNSKYIPILCACTASVHLSP